MHSADIPGKLPIPFANSAGGGYIRSIPQASQIGITDGAASLTDGFVPLNATPIGAGGVPPDIKDMNGILFEISGWARWVAAGGPVTFDAGFAAAIGGYPLGGVVQSSVSAGVFYVSTVDDNLTDPEGVGAAGWHLVVPVAADNAAVAAGADAAKFVTPAGLASLRASSADIIAGTSPSKLLTPLGFYGARASSAEVNAGTDDHKYVTPAALAGVSKLLATNGYVKRSDGLIEQWGQANSGSDGWSASYSFPIAFPNAALNIVANSAEIHIASTNGNEIAVRIMSATQFQIGSDDTMRFCNWRAIGY